MLVIGRSGSMMMVELGAMRTGGQVHCLDAQGIDPFLYLVIPRVLATALGVFCLNMVFFWWRWPPGWPRPLGLTSLTLLDSIEAVLVAMGPKEYALVPLKTLAIGFAIGLISCTTGLAVGRVVPEVSALLPRGFVKAVLATLLISGGLTSLLCEDCQVAIRHCGTAVVLVLDHATLLSDQPGGSETATVNMTLMLVSSP